MNEMKPISNSRSNMYKVAIILLLAYAAFSSAMKDLDRLQEVAGNLQEITSDGLGGLAKVYSATRSLAESPQLAGGPDTGARTETARVEVIAAGGSVELRELKRNAVAKTDNNGGAEFGSIGRRNHYVSVADNKMVKFFTSEVSPAGNKVACDKKVHNSAGKADKEANLNVLAQVPARVALLRRPLLIESDSDVVSPSPGRTMFRTIIRKAPARARGPQWSGVSEFKTLNEVISLGLASAKSDDAQTDGFVREVSDHFSFEQFDKVRRGVGSDETNEWATHE